MRLGHVACFSDVYYPILRHIGANKGVNLNRGPVLGKQTRKWQKKIVKNVIFSILKRVKSIDSFHIVTSLSDRSSIEKSIKSFLQMKGQIAY